MTTLYHRPIARTGAERPEGALALAGGWCWFSEVEILSRGAPSRIIPAQEAPCAVLDRLTVPRAPVVGLALDRPRIMGILNVTPDSFSDGGKFDAPAAAQAHARAMAEAGADMLDIGGESTRPGAQEVPVAEEIARTAPVIAALRQGGRTTPISIDTRKAAVAEAALAAGADLVNDVSGFGFDPAMAPLVARAGVPACLMHMRGTPETMKTQTAYGDVLLDVYDHLAARLDEAEALGIPRAHVIVDPGIGFAKTQEQNLSLLRRLDLFHALGSPILLGASRKGFIGVIGDAPNPADRAPGSVAVALAAAAQGVHFLRVHDIPETRQALRLAQAIWETP